MNAIKKILLFPMLCIPLLGFGQSEETFFNPTDQDIKRWEKNDDLLKDTIIIQSKKADSLYQLALIEYQKEFYHKTREYSELAISLDPTLSQPHKLIAKAYISSVKLCSEKLDNPVIKYWIIWAAIDEWEKAIAKGDKESEIWINRYTRYLLEEQEIRECFGDNGNQIEEGDLTFVGCWIQRDAKIRFRKNKNSR